MNTSINSSLIAQLDTRLPEIQAWIQRKQADIRSPFYTSVDIRDAGFKIAAVDANLFPAGFNNIHETNLPRLSAALRVRVLRTVPQCRHILLVTEEHTRNPWYLENVHVLASQFEAAGFTVRLATFLNNDPEFCKESNHLVLQSAGGHEVRLECLHHVIKACCRGDFPLDAIVLNNDLSVGIPDILAKTCLPVLTPPEAGWHARGKARHFAFANGLIREMCAELGLDPWLFSTYFASVSEVNIHEDADRKRVSEAAEVLFDRIAEKYAQYGIDEKPFVFLKSDSGTYGMGIHVLTSPEEIQEINRKVRNKLYKGKHAQVIGRYLLQEGVPSVLQHEGHSAEPCLYHVGDEVVGGFWRINSEKSARDNLNAAGMTFSPIAWTTESQTPSQALYAAVSALAVLGSGQELMWL